MSKLVLTLRPSQVIDGLRIRSDRAYAAVLASAAVIAQETNATLIPQVYPGRVAEALEAAPEIFRAGGRLAAVRVRATKPLFRWYEHGVRAHEEPLSGSGFMAFYWERIGDWKYTYHVSHPGYAGRHRLPELRALLAQVAYDEWYRALATTLR